MYLDLESLAKEKNTFCAKLIEKLFQFQSSYTLDFYNLDTQSLLLTWNTPYTQIQI